MPTTPRKSNTPRRASAPRTTTSAPEGAEVVKAAVQEPEAAAADEARSRPHARGHALVSVVTFPVTAVRAVAEDVVSTARRPDALVYWGGLAGLAVLGVLEWPAAAAVGVGVAIANGRRRTRA